MKEYDDILNRIFRLCLCSFWAVKMVLTGWAAIRYLEEQGFVENEEWQASSFGRSVVVDSKPSANAPLKMVRGHGFIRAPAHQVLEVRSDWLLFRLFFVPV
jgi:hypothetical protein